MRSPRIHRPRRLQFALIALIPALLLLAALIMPRDADAHATLSLISAPDGTLYLLYDNERHRTDPATLAALGFDEQTSRPVSQRTLEAIEQGSAVPRLANGDFLVGPDGARYLLHNGARRIPNATTFDANGWGGYGGFDAVTPQEIDGDLLAALPQKAEVAPAGRAGAGRFDWGYCTWWVASRRSVPWLGNANEWYGNARAMGYATGATPLPGAILVRHSASWSGYGHVAYVESVDGTSFTVSEMNINGLGQLTTRTYNTVSDPPPGLIGYVYWRYGAEPEIAPEVEPSGDLPFNPLREFANDYLR